MSNNSARTEIEILDVTARDGLQNESRMFSTTEKLGQLTQEVLTELLDLTPEQIEKLRASGIV